MQTANNSRVVYTTNGAVTTFSVAVNSQPIVFSANSQIKVSYAATDTASVSLVEGIDYTLTGGPEAGVVTTTNTLAAGNLVIWRTTPVSQTVDYRAKDNFPAEVTEDQLDEIVRMIQEFEERLGRTISLSLDDPSADFVIPSSPDRDNKILGFDTNGVLEATPISDAIISMLFSDGVTAIGGTVYPQNSLVFQLKDGTYISAGIAAFTSASVNWGGTHFT